ncbi:MAG: M67 family metallopeptidase [Campylobacteraceae bacterium]|nr:M67 family metallopeptidase [Campylobacteraceae bacterium]
MIVLDREFAQEINLHAEASYPDECCGILLGILGEEKEKIVKKLLNIDNARDEANRHNRFLITPADFAKASFAAIKEGLEIVGFYHSHPDHPSAPSQYDLEHAWPFYSYIIVSVKKGQADIISSWELENDRTKFNAEAIKGA